ncbi:MAG TPA: tetratricopeptide repeat protein, partial [Microlunatus sp.]|nr:tetratricopeptide repeat protein [Microlunatus sp.]
MSPRSSARDRAGSAALTRAARLQHRAVAENAGGHAARGAVLIHQALDLLEVDIRRLDCHAVGQHDPDRCRLLARLFATLAKSTVEVSGVGPALEAMDRARTWSSCLSDQSLDAFLLSQQALILFRGGRLNEAEAAFDAALALMQRDSIDAARVHINRGALYVERGSLARARDDLTRAVRLSRDLGDRQFEHIAVHNLACLEFLAGDLPLALRLMETSLHVDEQTLEGLTHLDRSRVLLAAGLPEEADDALDQAAGRFRRDRCWQDLAEVDLTRAEVALLTDRVVDARRLAGRARDRFRRHGNERWRRTAELVLLQADQAAGRQPARLLPHARRLVEEFASADLSTQVRTARLLSAELTSALGRTSEAWQQLSAVGRERPGDPIGIRLHRHLVRADILERRGELPAARRSLRRGLTELASYQAQFGGVDLQSASAVHGRRLATRDLELALRSGRATSVLAAVERSRAVSGRIRPVIPPADAHTARLLAELRRLLETAEPDRRRVAALQVELRSRSWLDDGSRELHPPTAVAELGAAAETDDLHLVTITQAGGRLSSATIASRGRPGLAELAAS